MATTATANQTKPLPQKPGAFRRGFAKLGDLTLSAVKVASPAIQQRFVQNIEAQTNSKLGPNVQQAVARVEQSLVMSNKGVEGNTKEAKIIAASAVNAGVDPTVIIQNLTDDMHDLHLLEFTNTMRDVFNRAYTPLDVGKATTQVNKEATAHNTFIGVQVGKVQKAFGIFDGPKAKDELIDLHIALKVFLDLTEDSLSAVEPILPKTFGR